MPSPALWVLAPDPTPWSCCSLPSSAMAHWAKPVMVSFWLLSVCSVTLAGVHHLSCFQLISPQAASSLPKRLNVMKVNDLVLSAYDSNTGRLAPRNGYSPDDQESQKFWSEIRAWYLAWDPWVETEYQALVQEVNASSPQAEPYYMQVLKACELDDATGAIQAITSYSLNGEDMLQYPADQNRWFSVHPAASRVAELWNREGDTSTVMNVRTLQQCRVFIGITAPFTAQKTAQPTVHVALVPETQDQLRRLVCHVTGFYPRDIEVTWEQGGQVAQGEQLTSGIRPNGDPTFQIQVSIELGQEGVDPAEHVCVVRHSSLGDAPLRVTWDSQTTSKTVVVAIVGGCILTALGVGVLSWYLRRRQQMKHLEVEKRRQEERLEMKLLKAEEEVKHLEAEAKRLEAETEAKRMEAEMEAKRLEAERRREEKRLEMKHLEAEAELKRLEAEMKRLQAETEAKRLELEKAKLDQPGKTIGFREAKPHSRPYMAYLDIQSGYKSSLCGGFLVSENFVLTAAHCNGDKITVILGAHNITKQEQSQQIIPVRRQIPHPQFSEETHNNDIMLLQLAKRAKLNRWVKTIDLPCANERVKPGTMCSVAGWGRTSTESESILDTLHEVEVEVLKDDVFLRNSCGQYHHYTASTMMCAGDPMMVKDPVLQGFGGAPLVCGETAQGIVSWGSLDGSFPGVYTRVSTFIPWIRATMRRL